MKIRCFFLALALAAAALLAGCGETTGTGGDYPAALMAGGVLYYSTGQPVEGVAEDAPAARVTAYTDALPTQDGENNFDRTLRAEYTAVPGGLAVRSGAEWILFEPSAELTENQS